ncbi:hypothetical protein [Psychrobacter raelei]|uniref:hypothetical protein n=1 Tax=Psychrobacter raelei TaxID=2565531 RepID=UPI003F61BB44
MGLTKYSQIQVLKESNRSNRQANNNLSDAERKAKRTQMRNAIANILTPEQRTQLEQMRAERQAKKAAKAGS